MNTISFKRVSLLLGIALTLGLGASAQAETVDSSAGLDPSTAPVITADPAQPISTLDRSTFRPTPSNITPDSISSSPSNVTPEAIALETIAPEQMPSETIPGSSVPGTSMLDPLEPNPASLERTSEDMPSLELVAPTTTLSEILVSPTPESTPQSQNQSSPEVAQTITPGRATASGSSYVGIGGNIGIGDGGTALGEGSFAVLSKIGLTSNLSVRPSVLFSDDATILIPVTFDFSFRETEVTEDVSEDIELSINPFLGAGIAISTGDDGSVDFLGTAGVDVPLSPRFTGTASVNASLFNDIAVGLLLGVGFNF